MRVFSANAVHPHACGENIDISAIAAGGGGSPPRLWGKRVYDARATGRRRFTPTPVGKTPGRSRPAASSQRFTPTPVGKTTKDSRPDREETVHPHACGENRLNTMTVTFDFGSPPRLWGKLFDCRRRECPLAVHPHACGENEYTLSPPASDQRFTPTPVGKTTTNGALRKRLTVHPHACGENTVPAVYQNPVAGSPPRLWGKRS